jgi:hypothetical protein
MNVFEKGLITICMTCGVFGAISLPLIFRKVPRNPIYGYRTRATLSDDGLWYEANAYFGCRFLLASLLAAGATVALYLWRGISPEGFLKLSIGLLLAPALIAWFLTARFVRSWMEDRR